MHAIKQTALVDVTKGPVRVLSMADNGDSASSFTTSDNDLLLSEFVDNSTDIAVLITAFPSISDTYVGSGWTRSTRVI